MQEAAPLLTSKHDAHGQAAYTWAQQRSRCKPAAVGVARVSQMGVIRNTPALTWLVPPDTPCFSPEEPNGMFRTQLLMSLIKPQATCWNTSAHVKHCLHKELKSLTKLFFGSLAVPVSKQILICHSMSPGCSPVRFTHPWRQHWLAHTHLPLALFPAGKSNQVQSLIKSGIHSVALKGVRSDVQVAECQALGTFLSASFIPYLSYKDLKLKEPSRVWGTFHAIWGSDYTNNHIWVK